MASALGARRYAAQGREVVLRDEDVRALPPLSPLRSALETAESGAAAELPGGSADFLELLAQFFDARRDAAGARGPARPITHGE